MDASGSQMRRATATMGAQVGGVTLSLCVSGSVCSYKRCATTFLLSGTTLVRCESESDLAITITSSYFIYYTIIAYLAVTLRLFGRKAATDDGHACDLMLRSACMIDPPCLLLAYRHCLLVALPHYSTIYMLT